MNSNSAAESLGVLQQSRPSTFADRGICVPFTTPILAQSRVRMNRNDRLECLLPGFSGGKGTYVFSWRAVPDVLKITLHDRALHKDILESKADSPDSIRGCALTIAARGFAGLAAAQQAKKLLAQDQQYVVLTNYVFVLELLKLVGVQSQDLLNSGLASDNSRHVAKAALNRAAERLKMPSDALYSRVEELSSFLAPIGFPMAPRPGRLRELLIRLEGFRDSVLRWSTADTTEAAALAAFIAQCADQTIQLARQRLARVDPLLTRVKDVVVGESRTEKEIRGGVSALSWVLDGWDYICQLWDENVDQSEDMQRIAMCEIYRIVPSMPAEELVVNENALLDTDDLKRVQRRWVRANQDWRATGLDYDAVGRLEQIKARMP